MFHVQTKATKKPVEVYDIKRDSNGYPHFLVYKDGQWVYHTAKIFEPYDPMGKIKYNTGDGVWHTIGE